LCLLRLGLIEDAMFWPPSSAAVVGTSNGFRVGNAVRGADSYIESYYCLPVYEEIQHHLNIHLVRY
jgi:hypothetical protein